MNATQQILDFASESGAITSADVDAMGISRSCLASLHRRGILARVERGVYQCSDELPDSLYLTQLRFPQGIYSGETALSLAGLTDQIVETPEMTFPSDYVTRPAKSAGLKVYQQIPERYTSGITTYSTVFGHTVRGYSPEKTLADLLLPRRHTEKGVIISAFRQYMRLPKNLQKIAHVVEFARMMGVDKKALTLLEILD